MQVVHFIADSSVFSWKFQLLAGNLLHGKGDFRVAGELPFAGNGRSNGHGPACLGQHPCRRSAGVILVETLQ